MRFPRTPGLFVSARFSVRASTFEVVVMYSILFIVWIVYIHDIQRGSCRMTLIVLTIFGSTRTNFGIQVSLKMRIMLFLSVTIAMLLLILILMHCFKFYLFLRSEWIVKYCIVLTALLHCFFYLHGIPCIHVMDSRPSIKTVLIRLLYFNNFIEMFCRSKLWKIKYRHWRIIFLYKYENSMQNSLSKIFRVRIH